MKHLNTLRIDAGYSIDDIARLTGVDAVTACQWLCGNACPGHQHLDRLADILGVEVEEIDEPPSEEAPPRRIDRLREKLVAVGGR